jgi:uncharacterized protein
MMQSKAFVFDYVLVKLAARCNLKCDYCYWFRDASVMDKPPVLTREVQAAFLDKLREHILRFRLKSFYILFHGGEPLMFGKQRFIDLCYDLRTMEKELGFQLRLGMTTNGILVDDEWAEILSYYAVEMTVSMDPTPASHDRHRVDLRKRGSYQRSLQGFQKLRESKLYPTALAVCDPEADVEEVFQHFVNTLELKAFDILIPDADHESEVPEISEFYRNLFDAWYDRYAGLGIKVRIIENMVRGMLGGRTNMESMGTGQLVTHTLHTDGSLEAVDILRIAGDGHNESPLNILTHALNDSQTTDLWQEAFHASTELPDLCKACRYARICGGGHVAHRWSKSNRYNNPSVYCGQLYELFSHVEGRLYADISYQSEPDGSCMQEIVE